MCFLALSTAPVWPPVARASFIRYPRNDGIAENARLENAELENPAPNHRGGKRGTGKRGNLKVMESRRCRKCAT